jgi:hypothetical protein
MGEGLIVLGLRHPFTGAVYEKDGDGHVLVTNRDGRTGLFWPNGRWISGEIEECDPQLCGWIGGPQIANHRVVAARQLSPEEYSH